MIDYSKMSDDEINCQVSFHIGLRTVERAEAGEFNPCNKPSDAWPIIIENGISIVRLDKNWLCAPIDEAIDGITGDNEVCFYASKGVVDHKPLRAAMIAFLMMQEEKKGG